MDEIKDQSRAIGWLLLATFPLEFLFAAMFIRASLGGGSSPMPSDFNRAFGILGSLIGAVPWSLFFGGIAYFASRDKTSARHALCR